MKDLFELLNRQGVTIVASSRTGSTEVYSAEDGLFLVEHLKSGRDVITPVAEMPNYLTVRYSPPKLAEGLLKEWAG